jgi:hypothetical protein
MQPKGDKEMENTSVYTIIYKLTAETQQSRQTDQGIMHHVDCYAGLEEAYHRMAESLERISGNLEDDHRGGYNTHHGYLAVQLIARRNGLDTNHGSIEVIKIPANASRYFIYGQLLTALNSIKRQSLNDTQVAA